MLILEVSSASLLLWEMNTRDTKCQSTARRINLHHGISLIQAPDRRRTSRRSLVKPTAALWRHVYYVRPAIHPPRDGMSSAAIDEIVLQNSQVNLRLNEIQLLLSEKRTSLSALQAGIALLALPLSVVSFLVATSSLYVILEVLWLLAPLLALCIVLVGLGSYLVVRAIVRIRGFDRKIRSIEDADTVVRELIEVD